MLEQELQKIGLSDKEARVYLSSLQLGKSPVQEIAQQSGVNRGTAYNIIESLMKKGLMSSFEQGKKTFFTAESPERLSSLIKIQEEELKLKEKEFSKYLPELRSMYGSADNKPKVKYYEGLEGLNAIKEEYLKTKSRMIYNLTNLDTLNRIFPKHFDDYTPRRIKNKIKSQFLYITSDSSIHISSDDKKLREAKKMSYKELEFSSDITIFDNKVSLVSLDKEIAGIIIENEDIANSVRAIFSYLWKKAK
jgi:HTH-type transcriptional regulator, sugar sensing transcriptional regulator